MGLNFGVVKVVAFFMRNTGFFRLRFFRESFSHFCKFMCLDGVDEVRFRGLRFSVRAGDLGIVPAMVRGDFERDELNFLRENLSEGQAFVDVGANVGVYSVIASGLVGEEGFVYSFEPESLNCWLLRVNAERLAAMNVAVFEYAVSDKNGTKDLFLNPSNYGSHRMHEKTGWNRVKVKQVCLDSILGDKKVDFVKIDVEGHEIEVLKGMKRLAKRNGKMVMIVEFNPLLLAEAGYTAVDLERQIKGMGFRMFSFGGGEIHDFRAIDGQNILCMKGVQ